MTGQTAVQACLIVFAKRPVFGAVKTRMRPFLSDADCLRLHSSLLRLWMRRLRAWDLGEVHKSLFLSPVETGTQAQELLTLPAGIAEESQQGDDLGSRLRQALVQKWKEGFRKIVFIGTDSPLIEIEDLQAAFQALNHNEVVLGPASDGGYYLIGFSELLPELFSGISWGTAEVFQETVRLLNSSSIRWHCLREGFDLDTYDDLVHFHRLLEKSSPLPCPEDQELVSLIVRLASPSANP